MSLINQEAIKTSHHTTEDPADPLTFQVAVVLLVLHPLRIIPAKALRKWLVMHKEDIRMRIWDLQVLLIVVVELH
ncbi:hypothetical protein HanIR_Chr10g0467031 [Helianthus annuus]|nr:hypothetical protein HanIR_Chr10g0467031 [Helianthus annuus]